MDHLVLALVLAITGIPLCVFGWVVGSRKFDLVFGNLTAESTDASAWEAAHKSAGQGFLLLGAFVTASAVMVAVVGMPAGGWFAGAALVSLTLGVPVVAARSVSRVARNQVAG